MKNLLIELIKLRKQFCADKGVLFSANKVAQFGDISGCLVRQYETRENQTYSKFCELLRIYQVDFADFLELGADAPKKDCKYVPSWLLVKQIQLRSKYKVSQIQELTGHDLNRFTRPNDFVAIRLSTLNDICDAAEVNLAQIYREVYQDFTNVVGTVSNNFSMFFEDTGVKMPELTEEQTVKFYQLFNWTESAGLCQ